MYSVLLVDDEPLAIEGLQLFVDWEKHGFRICGVCENGAEALTAAQQLMPDVVVTDIRMPQMDGLELIEQLQKGVGAASQFIVVSAYSEFAFAKRAIKLGVYHYLLKPIIEEEADEVLMQVRMRLDNDRALQRKAEDGEAITLPALAVQRMKQVVQAIEDGDVQRALQEIDSLFLQMGSHSLDWFELFVGSLTIQCSKLISEAGGDSSLLPILSSDPLQKGNSELEFIRGQIFSYTEQIIQALQSLRKDQPGGTLTEVDKYVCDNYRDSLTIRDVAAKFFINPVYLGRAYQERYGLGLIDRMHDLRISEACDKLRCTSDPIYAIAEQVGYVQYHYFLRQFEQRTGMKPMEYRSSKG